MHLIILAPLYLQPTFNNMSTNKGVHIGMPPKGFKDWTSNNVYFHGFADLTTTRGEYIQSPEFSCLGHQWRMYIHPGGHPMSPEGYVAIGLANMSKKRINIRFGYSVRNVFGKEMVYGEETREFAEVGYQPLRPSSWSFDLAPRPTLMDALVDGSLLIEVRIKSTAIDDESITQFIPTNPLSKNVLQKFMDEESADVVFEVDNGSLQSDEEHTNKKSKTTTTFYAHRFILQDISTMLAELCKPVEGSGEGITTVSISDVKPEIFRHMIYYTYGGKLSEEELKNNAKDIINACDKYSVVHLKLEAEATYVKSNEITMDNMMDNLLYADSKNLALLKEAVMDYIVANKDDIIGKVSFDNIPGFATDLLTAMSRGEQNSTIGDITNYNKMRVGTLRKLLDEKGLDVDGSRETMIALLKETSA